MTELSPISGPAPGFQSHPHYQVEILPCAKRLRATFDGQTVFDTLDAVIMRETKHLPIYYVPRDGANMALIESTGHVSHCPFKGNASYFSLRHGDRLSENAVWTYETPFDECRAIKDYLGFYWDELDHWYEEDDEVFVHARDPKARIDIVASSRPVHVESAGETIGETTRALFLFETGLPARYYVPADDVRQDMLIPSATRTRCPYKGMASYHHVKIGDTRIDDAVWTYPDPLAEVSRIAGYLCFYPEKVGRLTVDGKDAG